MNIFFVIKCEKKRERENSIFFSVYFSCNYNKNKMTFNREMKFEFARNKYVFKIPNSLSPLPFHAWRKYARIFMTISIISRRRKHANTRHWVNKRANWHTQNPLLLIFSSAWIFCCVESNLTVFREKFQWHALS